ncbi:MAG TPA: isopentenyl-diphosphate Delta-isomerase [Pyrinomonadaceae bacterium]|nr:isopentenyl-diphosphate Delta-isomerase [Pyrinomonadaceae bacterium]
MEEVILVNENDNVIGKAEKMEAHMTGKLHRAFSVFIFDRAGRLLMQKRARTKYHSASLWSNTCCSHPRPEEATGAAARRRLREEMGIDCELREVFAFTYLAELENDLVEHEIDHVFTGNFDGVPSPDAREIDDWKWIDVATLLEDIRERPGQYSYWLKTSIDELLLNLTRERRVRL